MKYIRFLLILTISFVVIKPLSAEKYYTIQLATGHYNPEGFEFIKKEVNKLDQRLKKHTRIILDDDYYILYAFLSETKKSVEQVFPEYKKLFKDAYIRQHDPSKVKTIKDFSISEDFDKNLSKVESQQNNLLFSNDMLIDRTIYVLYINKDQKDDIALISLELHNDFTMYFSVLIGEEYAGEGKFFVDFQGRFYVYSNEEQRYRDFYILKEKNRDYMVVEAWENGKKTNNEIMFFYSFVKARRFIDSLKR